MPRLKQRTLLAVAGATVSVLAVAAPAATAALDGEQSRASSSTVSSPQAPSAAARGAAYIETRLLFGTERPDGGPDVTDPQFMAFIDQSVTPIFPSGLTIQEGRGQWRDANGVIERERSYELILLYPAGEARARDPQIEHIREAYIKEYEQESVARLDEPTRVDF